uniref:Uncharacterized protein n=1 Tax=Arundo donax TaxID=35708 RepID=A0A0A9HU77_ARUDO
MGPGFISLIPWPWKLLSAGSRDPGTSWLRLMSFPLTHLLARMRIAEAVILNKMRAIQSLGTPHRIGRLLSCLEEVAILP